MPTSSSPIPPTADAFDLLVIGASYAGLAIAAAAREAGFAGTIGLAGDEAELPYQRPPLSKGFLLGKAGAHLPLKAASFFAEADIAFLPRPNTEVAFKLRAGFDRRAAAHLPQHAFALEIVEIAMDRHLRDGKALGQIVKADDPALDQRRHDSAPAILSLHLIILQRDKTSQGIACIGEL